MEDSQPTANYPKGEACISVWERQGRRFTELVGLVEWFDFSDLLYSNSREEIDNFASLIISDAPDDFDDGSYVPESDVNILSNPNDLALLQKFMRQYGMCPYRNATLGAQKQKLLPFGELIVEHPTREGAGIEEIICRNLKLAVNPTHEFARKLAERWLQSKGVADYAANYWDYHFIDSR